MLIWKSEWMAASRPDAHAGAEAVHNAVENRYPQVKHCNGTTSTPASWRTDVEGAMHF